MTGQMLQSIMPQQERGDTIAQLRQQPEGAGRKELHFFLQFQQFRMRRRAVPIIKADEEYC